MSISHIQKYFKFNYTALQTTFTAGEIFAKLESLLIFQFINLTGFLYANLP